MKQIRTINLKENQIQTLESNAFNNLKNITHIDLRDNKINTFPATILKNTYVYQNVNLQNNPLSCDCYLVSLELKTLISTQKIKGKCVTPTKFQDRVIASLTRKELKCTTCDFNECKNNAQCVTKNDYYQCVCQKNFNGKFCENKIDGNDQKQTMWIIVGVVIVVLVGLAAFGVYYYCRNRWTKTHCCCCCFLLVVVLAMLLFLTLRIVSYMYEED